MLAGLALASAAFAPASLASDVTGIGYVDETALADLKPFKDASAQFERYQTHVQGAFAAQMHAAKSAADQQKIAQAAKQKLADRQRTLFGPLFARAQVAIASVASSHNLSVVLDKRIVVYGGTNVTKDVASLLTDFGNPVPPVTTPLPSNVGYVDQTKIDDVPKLKSASDDFAKFRDDQMGRAQTKMKSAKTDADRRKIFDALQRTLTDKRKATIDPLVDLTKSAIGAIARKKGLVLVVDRATLLYGGVDITGDVVTALK
ncbi:MAG: OmpH family outer membrane protein [Vulcanimicrobiaceae bacterium]